MFKPVTKAKRFTTEQIRLLVYDFVNLFFLSVGHLISRNYLQAVMLFVFLISSVQVHTLTLFQAGLHPKPEMPSLRRSKVSESKCNCFLQYNCSS